MQMLRAVGIEILDRLAVSSGEPKSSPVASLMACCCNCHDVSTISSMLNGSVDDEALLAVQSEDSDAVMGPGDLAPIPAQSDVRGDHEVTEWINSNHMSLSHDEYSLQALDHSSELRNVPDNLDLYRQDHTGANADLLSGLASEPGTPVKLAGHSLGFALRDALDNYQHRASAFFNEDVCKSGFTHLDIPQDLKQADTHVSWAEPRFLCARLHSGQDLRFMLQSSMWRKSYPC